MSNNQNKQTPKQAKRWCYTLNNPVQPIAYNELTQDYHVYGEEVGFMNKKLKSRLDIGNRMKKDTLYLKIKKKKKKRNELIDKYLLKMAIEGFID